MAENQTKCTGNCMACTIFQRQYCASQLAYSNMKMLEQMQQAAATMQQDIKALKEKVEAMQNSEAALIDPMSNPQPTVPHTPTGITQCRKATPCVLSILLL